MALMHEIHRHHDNDRFNSLHDWRVTLPSFTHSPTLSVSPKTRTPSPKRTKRPEKRVKTGCLTCKERHVKCDEMKPICARCRDRGTTCKGYPAAVLASYHVLTKTHKPSLRVKFSMLSDSERERHSLDFFRERTAPQLSGHFEPEFWSTIILQLGDTQPAVRCALTALSSFHEETELLSMFPTKRVEAEDRRRYALQQYSKAMSHLRDHLEIGGQLSMEVTLTSCVLFILVESLLGDYDAVLAHLESGLDIICTWHAKNKKRRDMGFTDSSSTLIPQHLIPLFTSLDLQASSLLAVRYPKLAFAVQETEQGSPAHLPAVFSTLEQGRDSLYTELCLMIGFLRSLDSYSADLPADVISGFVQQQKYRLAALEQWNSLMQALMRKLGINAKPQNMRGAVQLKLYYKLAIIMLGTCMTRKSAAYDAYVKDFAAIVSLAASLDGLEDRNASKYLLCFDMGIVPPLYYTAIHCPDEKIRDQALQILDSSSRREGVCDGLLARKVARRIISMEKLLPAPPTTPTMTAATTTTEELQPVKFSKISVDVCTNQRRGLMQCCSDTDKGWVFQEWITW